MNLPMAPLRRRRLKRDDFTIISNNCWAGSVYRYFGLPYKSPTAGLFFFAKDYVKFCSRLMHYTSVPLEFINPKDSAHYAFLASKDELQVPIARLDDIEVIFLHYPTRVEAEKKWRRRCERINWDNLLIKFSQMNECEIQDLVDFDNLPFERKICFTAERNAGIRCGVYFRGYEGTGNIDNDTTYFTRGINITKWLNTDPVTYELG